MKSTFPVYKLISINTYKNEGILASRFGTYLETNPHFLKPHKHDFYHLVYFTQGMGSHYLDFKHFDIKPGTIYFMIPGQVHTWNFSEKPDGYIVNFSPDYFNSFLLNPNYLQNLYFFTGNLDNQVLNLSPEIQQSIEKLFEEIINSKHLNHDLFDDFVRINLLKIFIEIAQNVPSKISTQTDSFNRILLGNFKKLIDSHYKTLKLPKDYASLLYITPNHLNAVCNANLGQSAGELIRERVLLEAKRLLMNFDLRIGEIAEILGFNDQSYFIRFFKRHENLSPEKFRNQFRYEK